MSKAIVLLSGGIDSTVTLYYAREQGCTVHALTLNYGQLHEIEITKAKKITQDLRIDHLILPITLPWQGSALLDSTIPIPENKTQTETQAIPVTYVPARNTIFLSFALSWAEVIGADSIFIGANQLDYSGYPDCRETYLTALQQAFALGTKRGVEGTAIRIEAPLLRMDKKDIILFGQKLGVPFRHTWSCYKGGKHPCKVCDSCFWRQKGFTEAGLADPLLK